MIVSVLVPREFERVGDALAWRRCRRATRMITAATPIRMPSMVRADRGLLAVRPRHANAALSETFMRPFRLAVAHRWRGVDAARCARRSGSCRRASAESASRGRRRSSSWVITTTVRPAAESLSKSSSTSSVLWLSRAPVGSSASSRTGSVAIARATATRCCWPPDSWAGRCGRPGRPGRPAPARPGRARAARGRRPRRRPAAARRCDRAVVRAIRLKLWKTKPILRLRISDSCRSSSGLTSTPSSR